MKVSKTKFWDAETLWERDTWRIDLPEEAVEDFSQYYGPYRDPERIGFDEQGTPAFSLLANRVRHNLLAGDGLCWIRGLGSHGLSENDRRCFYAALGCALGEPMKQYGRLYEVADRGGSYRSQAIPVSQTSAGTGFHTDSSSRDVVPDVVGLLCEQQGAKGGDSLVSNALRVHEVLRRQAPETLALLSRDYIRDIVTPGAERTMKNVRRNQFPIFGKCRRDPGIQFRYMRYWIERGHERVGTPLEEDVLAALDELDELLAAPEQSVRFRLEPGDILWVNNRTLAHNRCGYEDSPSERRRLQRMWIRVA